jgi:hypothetical protein
VYGVENPEVEFQGYTVTFAGELEFPLIERNSDGTTGAAPPEAPRNIIPKKPLMLRRFH